MILAYCIIFCVLFCDVVVDREEAVSLPGTNPLSITMTLVLLKPGDSTTKAEVVNAHMKRRV